MNHVNMQLCRINSISHFPVLYNHLIKNIFLAIPPPYPWDDRRGDSRIAREHAKIANHQRNFRLTKNRCIAYNKNNK